MCPLGGVARSWVITGDSAFWGKEEGSIKGQCEGKSLGNIIKILPIYICALRPCKKSQLITYRISLKEIFKVSNFSSTLSLPPECQIQCSSEDPEALALNCPGISLQTRGLMSLPHSSPRVSLCLLSQRCGNNLLFAQHLIVYKTSLYKLCFLSLTTVLRGDENVSYFSDEQTKGHGS